VCLGAAKRPGRSDMLRRHGVGNLAGDALRVLLMDELGEDGFEICEL